MFFGRSSFGVDLQSVLNQLSGYTRHVSGLPCEDVPVLMEELDELGFLFRVKSC